MAKLSVNELNKRIDALNTKAQGIMVEYQEVGLLCLQHLADHGDVGPVNRMYNGMPKGARRNAMGVWFMKYGSLEVNQDAGTKAAMPMRYTKQRQTDIEAATAKMWWDEIPERHISEIFDLRVAVQSLLNRAKGKTLKIGGEDKPHEAHSMLKMLAVGVGLPNPYADEEAKAAEAAAKQATEAAAATAKDAVSAAVPATAAAPTKAQADKPAVKREAKATAAAKPAAKKAKGKRERATA